MNRKISNEMLDRLAQGLGCENCGKPVKGETKYGYLYCGDQGCAYSLNIVGRSIETARVQKQKDKEAVERENKRNKKSSI